MCWLTDQNGCSAVTIGRAGRGGVVKSAVAVGGSPSTRVEPERNTKVCCGGDEKVQRGRPARSAAFADVDADGRLAVGCGQRIRRRVVEGQAVRHATSVDDRGDVARRRIS